MEVVYVLELEDSKYYIGWTQDLNTRIASHFLGRGSVWTRMYKPIKIVSIQAGSKDLENALTIAYMCEKGWRNCRGGKWCAA